VSQWSLVTANSHRWSDSSSSQDWAGGALLQQELLLPGRWSLLQRLCCSFSWRQCPPSLVVKMLLINPVLPRFQGGSRREWIRAKYTDIKWRLECLAFNQLQFICGPKKGVSALQQKQLLSTCYIIFNLSHNPMESTLSFSFYRGENWASEVREALFPRSGHSVAFCYSSWTN
jgi:hypothetical protein